MQGIKNKIYVRQEFTGKNTNSIHGQNIGDIIICTRDDDSGIAYGDRYIASGHNDFREATKEEIIVFGKGIKNINDIKVEKFKAPKDSIWVRKEEIVLLQSIPGRKKGDIVKQNQDNDNTIYYDDKNSGSLLSFREATPKEIEAYERGIRNIKDMVTNFKKGDILEFISKKGITTCFNVGQRVTFIEYDDRMSRVSGLCESGSTETVQSAYSDQFKLITSSFEEDKSNIEIKLEPIPGFEVGNIVECIVSSCQAFNEIKKGDKIKIWEIDFSRGLFKGERPEYKHSTPWPGLRINEFQPVAQLITEPKPKPIKFNKGDRVIGNAEANYYSITKEGIMCTVQSVEGDTMYVKADGDKDSYKVRTEYFELVPKVDKTEVVSLEYPDPHVHNPYLVGIDSFNGTSASSSGLMSYDDVSIATSMAIMASQPEIDEHRKKTAMIYGTSGNPEQEIEMPILFNVERI